MDPRTWWTLFEPVHAVVYFGPAAKQAYADAGLKGGWMGYFASRAAAMGPVPPEVVIATFYNFHPSMVRRALPDAWSFSTPERVLEARTHVADSVLSAALGDLAGDPAFERAVAIARGLAERCSPAGRPLFAAHASLPWPEPAHLSLWHAATLLREYRGDGHVVALVAHGVGPCEAHILQAGIGKVDPATQRTFRGWSEEEWQAAADGMRSAGWIDEADALLPAGRAVLEAVEADTDRLAAPPFADLSEGDATVLAGVLTDVYERITGRQSLPYPNPMGLPKPGTASAS